MGIIIVNALIVIWGTTFVMRPPHFLVITTMIKIFGDKIKLISTTTVMASIAVMTTTTVSGA